MGWGLAVLPALVLFAASLAVLGRGGVGDRLRQAVVPYWLKKRS